MWPTLSNRCIPVPRNNTLWAWDMCWDEWTVGGVANILALVKGLAAISGKFCTSLAIQLKSLVYFLQIPLLCKFACQNFARSFVYKFMCWHIFRLGSILLLGWRWLCTARATGTSGFSGCSTGEVKCLSTLPDLCPSLPLATHNSLSLSVRQQTPWASLTSFSTMPARWVLYFSSNVLHWKGILDEMTQLSDILEWNWNSPPPCGNQIL